MAQEWIKVRSALANHPKVVAMTRVLLSNTEFREWVTPGGGGDFNGQIISNGASRKVTLGALLGVWFVARQHGEFVGNDLVLKGNQLSDLDQFAGVPGIGWAMKEVGWATTKNGVTLPNFKNYNVPLSGAERAARHRERGQRNRNEEITQSNVQRAHQSKSKSKSKSINIPLTPFRGSPLSPPGNSVCTYCGVRQDQVSWAFDWDHFVPRAEGGTDAEQNLVPACHVCNQIKQKRIFKTIEEARQHIHWKLWTSGRKRYEQPKKFCFGGKPPSGDRPPTITRGMDSSSVPFSQRPENRDLKDGP